MPICKLLPFMLYPSISPYVSSIVNTYYFYKYLYAFLAIYSLPFYGFHRWFHFYADFLYVRAAAMSNDWRETVSRRRRAGRQAGTDRSRQDEQAGSNGRKMKHATAAYRRVYRLANGNIAGSIQNATEGESKRLHGYPSSHNAVL